MHDRRVCVKQSRIPRQRDGCMDGGTRENHSSSNFNIFLPPARHQHQHQPPANLRGHRVLKRLIITSRKCVAKSFVAGRVNLEDNFIGLGCWCGGHWPGAGGGLQQCKQRHPITHQAPCTSPHTSYWPLQLQLVACNGHVVHCDNTRLQIPAVWSCVQSRFGPRLQIEQIPAPILCWCQWEGTSQQPAAMPDIYNIYNPRETSRRMFTLKILVKCRIYKNIWNALCFGSCSPLRHPANISSGRISAQIPLTTISVQDF